MNGVIRPFILGAQLVKLVGQLKVIELLDTATVLRDRLEQSCNDQRTGKVCRDGTADFTGFLYVATHDDHVCGRALKGCRDNVAASETFFDDLNEPGVGCEQRTNAGLVDAFEHQNVVGQRLELGHELGVIDITLLLHQRNGNAIGTAEDGFVFLVHLHIRVLERHHLVEPRIHLQLAGRNREADCHKGKNNQPHLSIVENDCRKFFNKFVQVHGALVW